MTNGDNFILYRQYEKLARFLNDHNVRVDDDGDLFFPETPDDPYLYVTYRELEGKWKFLESTSEEEGEVADARNDSHPDL